MTRAQLLRWLGKLAHAGLLLVLFGVAAYVSFSVFVRSGVTRTPDLTGLSREEATATLRESGLVWTKTSRDGIHSESVPAGHVVTQRPRSGSLVKRGSAVEPILSLGPQLLTVPDLRGQTLQSAEATLAAVGLHLGRALQVLSEAAPGTVIEQQPAAATAAPSDGAVDVFLALEGTANAYLMPDLVYRDADSVRRFFQARGFVVAGLRSEPYEGIPEGVILRQSPLAGHLVHRHDPISLVVASRMPRP